MNWIRYDSERIWNYLIGSGIPSYVQVCYEYVDNYQLNQCLASAEGGIQTELNQDYASCLAVATVSTCYAYYASTNGQSDGFIKAPSQAGFGSAWANNAIRVEALGVNHLQMRKHPAMESIYRRAFDGEFGFEFKVSR